MKTLLSLVCLLSLVLLAPSCQSTASEAAAPVNMTCPIGGEPVDTAATSDFEGTTVGFCCKKCMGKFDRMDREAKAAALKEAGIDVK